MRRLASSPATWFILTVLSLVLHVLWARSSGDPAIVARAGAIWVIFAGVIIARPVIRRGYAAWYAASLTIDGGSAAASVEEEEHARQEALDARCLQVFGPSLAIAGTILWAYGDLIASPLVQPNIGAHECDRALTKDVNA